MNVRFNTKDPWMSRRARSWIAQDCLLRRLAGWPVASGVARACLHPRAPYVDSVQ